MEKNKRTGFVGLQTFRPGVSDAVISFNEGSIAKADVLERIGIKPGMSGMCTIETLKSIDRVWIIKADKGAEEGNKK